MTKIDPLFEKISVALAEDMQMYHKDNRIYKIKDVLQQCDSLNSKSMA